MRGVIMYAWYYGACVVLFCMRVATIVYVWWYGLCVVLWCMSCDTVYTWCFSDVSWCMRKVMVMTKGVAVKYMILSCINSVMVYA